MSDILQVSNLSKVYSLPKGGRSIRAVDSIHFAVGKGEVFGFLGPNGAGKTTTIRMLTGLSRPTQGEVIVFGLELYSHLTQVKKQMGIVPDQSNLYDELSALDNLIFDMQLYGVARAERVGRAKDLLEQFGLLEKQNTPFARLSRGMKRSLTVAAALAHQPAILFLDEPTTGLDVMSARKLRRMIAALREQGVTIFLTTHYLEEAERLCDRIALIVEGRIIAIDTVDGLKKLIRTQAAKVEVTWRNQQGQSLVESFEAETVDLAIRAAISGAAGREILSMNTLQPSLEEAFVELTGLDKEIMLAEKSGGKG